jgi:hypothetical protein
MSTHRLRASCPFANSDDGIEVEITYSFRRGRPAKMYLRNGDPGHPADPDEIELVSAKPVDKTFVLPAPLQKALEEWADLYIADDDGFYRAVENACADVEDAREYAAELRRERV